MFLICFGSSSTYSTIPLVANHPTISFWALSHVVLASMQGQQDQEKIFSAQLSYQLRRHCPPKHGMLWPSAGPFGTVISCHLKGETIEPSAMYHLGVSRALCFRQCLFSCMPKSQETKPPSGFTIAFFIQSCRFCSPFTSSKKETVTSKADMSRCEITIWLKKKYWNFWPRSFTVLISEETQPATLQNKRLCQ